RRQPICTEPLPALLDVPTAQSGFGIRVNGIEHPLWRQRVPSALRNVLLAHHFFLGLDALGLA
ncbi:MAG: hypothetical protein WD928_07845, partial [Gammaproteobacteria bacterium]